MAIIPEALATSTATDRPYVVANFVASADGRAAVDGGSTGLGDAGDRQIFRALRGCADAVLAGTGTIAAEHYGALARDPAVVALRARRSLPPQPPLVTIARSGRVPAIPLLDDPASTLIVYAGTDVTAPEGAATVVIERDTPGRLAVRDVLTHLRREHGVRLLLCEGGPSLFSALLAERCVDELFLTVAGALVGGDGGAITAGAALSPPLRLVPRWTLAEGDSLYVRYGVTP